MVHYFSIVTLFKIIVKYMCMNRVLCSNAIVSNCNKLLNNFSGYIQFGPKGILLKVEECIFPTSQGAGLTFLLKLIAVIEMLKRHTNLNIE